MCVLQMEGTILEIEALSNSINNLTVSVTSSKHIFTYLHI